MAHLYLQKILKRDLLTQKEIADLCDGVINLLIQQPNVLTLQTPIIVCGDIHGQFFDLLQLFKQGGTVKDNQYIFLGDYVDRGYHSTQTVLLLLTYKLLHPNNIHMLRGNHECKSLTQIYGFYDEVFKKYGNINPWKHITKVFQYLPLAARLNDKLLCVHGGLSPELPWIEDIYALQRVMEIGEKGPLADLLWSDPDLYIDDWKVNSRGAGYLFPQKVVKQFNYLNKIETVIRSHQLAEEGFTYNFLNQCLLTVWSAPNYCYRCGNRAAILLLDKELNRKFVQYDSAQENNQYNVSTENVLPYFL